MPYSAELLQQLRQTLRECEEFDSDDVLRAVFVTPELSGFKGDIREATSPYDRVNKLLERLDNKRLVGNRPVLPFFLRALRDRRSESESLYGRLSQMSELADQALREFVPIPFVIAAMTNVEAEELENETIFVGEEIAPAERRRFRAFRQALAAYCDIDRLESYYGGERELWKPVAYGDLTISDVIERALNHRAIASARGHNAPRLHADYLTEDFFSEAEGMRREVCKQMDRLGGVVIVDAISMFHPDVGGAIHDSGVDYKGDVALLIVTPVGTRELQVNQLVEQIAKRRVHEAFDKWHEDLDELREIGLGDTHALMRRLATILPNTISKVCKFAPSDTQQQRWQEIESGPVMGINNGWKGAEYIT